MRKLGSENYDLVLTDMRLPDRDEIEIVEWIQANRPGVPVSGRHRPRQRRGGGAGAETRRVRLQLSKPLDLGALRKPRSRRRSGSAATWRRPAAGRR
ncbi:MAG: hypothetical protein U1E63_17700 [Burkholderiales bacterium]